MQQGLPRRCQSWLAASGVFRFQKQDLIRVKGNAAPCLNGYTPAPCRVQTGRKRLGNYPFFSGNLEFQESGLMMWKVGRVGRRKKGRVGRVGIKVRSFL